MVDEPKLLVQTFLGSIFPACCVSPRVLIPLCDDWTLQVVSLSSDSPINHLSRVGTLFCKPVLQSLGADTVCCEHRHSRGPDRIAHLECGSATGKDSAAINPESECYRFDSGKSPQETAGGCSQEMTFSYDKNENWKWLLLLIIIAVALLILILKLRRELRKFQRQLHEVDLWR
jgi:hypothetical protein